MENDLSVEARRGAAWSRSQHRLAPTRLLAKVATQSLPRARRKRAPLRRFPAAIRWPSTL